MSLLYFVPLDRRHSFVRGVLGPDFGEAVNHMLCVCDFRVGYKNAASDDESDCQYDQEHQATDIIAGSFLDGAVSALLGGLSKMLVILVRV